MPECEPLRDPTTVMSCSSDAVTPRKLICVLGVASGVPGNGETVTLATDAAVVAGAADVADAAVVGGTADVADAAVVGDSAEATDAAVVADAADIGPKTVVPSSTVKASARAHARYPSVARDRHRYTGEMRISADDGALDQIKDVWL